jgi:hypothetical protein
MFMSSSTTNLLQLTPAENSLTTERNLSYKTFIGQSEKHHFLLLPTLLAAV